MQIEDKIIEETRSPVVEALRHNAGARHYSYGPYIWDIVEAKIYSSDRPILLIMRELRFKLRSEIDDF